MQQQSEIDENRQASASNSELLEVDDACVAACLKKIQLIMTSPHKEALEIYKRSLLRFLARDGHGERILRSFTQKRYPENSIELAVLQALYLHSTLSTAITDLRKEADKMDAQTHSEERKNYDILIGTFWDAIDFFCATLQAEHFETEKQLLALINQTKQATLTQAQLMQVREEIILLIQNERIPYAISYLFKHNPIIHAFILDEQNQAIRRVAEDTTLFNFFGLEPFALQDQEGLNWIDYIRSVQALKLMDDLQKHFFAEPCKKTPSIKPILKTLYEKALAIKNTTVDFRHLTVQQERTLDALRQLAAQPTLDSQEESFRLAVLHNALTHAQSLIPTEGFPLNIGNLMRFAPHIEEAIVLYGAPGYLLRSIVKSQLAVLFKQLPEQAPCEFNQEATAHTAKIYFLSAYLDLYYAMTIAQAQPNSAAINNALRGKPLSSLCEHYEQGSDWRAHIDWYQTSARTFFGITNIADELDALSQPSSTQ